MKKKVKKKIAKDKCKKMDFNNYRDSGSGLYFIGFIGAAIYYIQNATSFWNGAFGILKALVWPAILIYKSLGFLGA